MPRAPAPRQRQSPGICRKTLTLLLNQRLSLSLSALLSQLTGNEFETTSVQVCAPCPPWRPANDTTIKVDLLSQKPMPNLLLHVGHLGGRQTFLGMGRPKSSLQKCPQQPCLFLWYSCIFQGISDSLYASIVRLKQHVSALENFEKFSTSAPSAICILSITFHNPTSSLSTPFSSATPAAPT